MKKTLIAVPCMDQVPAPFAASLATLKKAEDTLVAFQISSLVYTARNELAAAAIRLEADFILWLDSDMVFEPDTLQRLLDDYQQGKGDIISGLYFRRVAPFTPVLYEKYEITGPNGAAIWRETTKIPDEIFEVGGCGFGCVLMPTDILFDVMGKYGNPFDPIGGSGEDLSFCWRARNCGYKIVCDPSISCGHVSHQVITRQYYEAFTAHGGKHGSSNTDDRAVGADKNSAANGDD